MSSGFKYIKQRRVYEPRGESASSIVHTTLQDEVLILFCKYWPKISQADMLSKLSILFASIAGVEYLVSAHP